MSSNEMCPQEMCDALASNTRTAKQEAKRVAREARAARKEALEQAKHDRLMQRMENQKRWLAAKATMDMMRAERRIKEEEELYAAQTAAIAVQNGTAAKYRFNPERLFDLGMEIMDELNDELDGRRIGGDNFYLTTYTCGVGFPRGGDMAYFTLNQLTGEIAVELKGSGGQGGNQWYVTSTRREGSGTQERANYMGRYITDILQDVAVEKL